MSFQNGAAALTIEKSIPERPLLFYIHFPFSVSHCCVYRRNRAVGNCRRSLTHLFYPDISRRINARNRSFHFFIYRNIAAFQRKLRIQLRIRYHACIDEDAAAGACILSIFPSDSRAISSASTRSVPYTACSRLPSFSSILPLFSTFF